MTWANTDEVKPLDLIDEVAYCSTLLLASSPPTILDRTQAFRA